LTAAVVTGLAVAAVLALVILTARAVWPAYRESIDPVVRQVFGGADLPVLLTVSLMAGVSEELLFRGVLQELIGLVPAAALFGFLHWGFRRELWTYGATAVFLGLALGLAYRWSGHLLVPMTAHAAYDAIVSVALLRGASRTKR